MRDCITAGSNIKTCMGSMADHCAIVEHYGNWETGKDGEHSHPMPQQCSHACKWGHCMCSDGRTCHFSHSAENDKDYEGKTK